MTTSSRGETTMPTISRAAIGLDRDETREEAV